MDSIYGNNNVLDGTTKPQDNALCDKDHFCRVARQITIPAHTQATVLVSCQGYKIKTIETNCNFGEGRYSMNARGLMQVLPGKLFYVYIAKFNGKTG